MDENLSLRQVLAEGTASLRGIVTQPRRDAELLLMRCLGWNRAWLLTHSDELLTPAQITQYEQWLSRRALHEPIQYITGEQEFYGLTFHVTPAVLIPRPETEHLVEAALARIPHNTPLRIADIGTGSGAIAIALAHTLPQANVTALDLSPSALAVAQNNAQKLGVIDRIRFLESDLLQAVSGEHFDIIVSNPPYVPQSEILEPQVRDYEPATALYAGASGLDIYERLIPQAHAALKPEGWLLMEIGHGQREALTALLKDWNEVSFIDDLQGIPRVACAKRRSRQYRHIAEG
jgi:release factor glutamine methyltransferase